MSSNNPKFLKHQRFRLLLPAFCCLCFQGIFITPNVDVSATTFECFDHSGHMIFTDSPAQLLDCREYNLGSESQKPPAFPSGAIKKLRNPEALSSSLPTSPKAQEDIASALTDILKPSDSYPSPTFTVPITNMGGVAIVHAILNRTNEVNLLIDPSQPMTVFSFDLGKQLGLLPPTWGKMKGNDSSENNPVPKVTQVGMIQIGAANAREVPVRIDNLPNATPGISGLLGMSFFKNFRADLDLDRGYLQLQQLYPEGLLQEGPSK